MKAVTFGSGGTVNIGSANKKKRFRVNCRTNDAALVKRTYAVLSPWWQDLRNDQKSIEEGYEVYSAYQPSGPSHWQLFPVFVA